MTVHERQKDILSIISSLDISPTLYKNAVEKYETITSFLVSCGIEADIYPQGSFAFGTVVRPNTKSSSPNYDLDFICQVSGDRDAFTPSELRKRIECALTSSNIYGGKLTVYNECFTIEYADINGVGFTIDIVPATAENIENKNRLIEKSASPELIETSIAIPRYNDYRNYDWLTNNPKGFKTWFDKINEPFLIASREAVRQHIFEENRTVFSSIDEIPSALERSSLQRVIQILKHHRDIYYAMRSDGESIKPISAIINAVVAQISQGYRPNCAVFELLDFILSEFNIYEQQQRLTPQIFAQKFENRSVITRKNGVWWISNPANPEDNLANKWNSDSNIPIVFFKWIEVVKHDLVSSLQFEDLSKFRMAIENGLGNTVVSYVLGEKYCKKIAPKPIVSSTAAKPYRCYDSF